MGNEKNTLKSYLISLLELDEKEVTADGLGFLNTEIAKQIVFTICLRPPWGGGVERIW